MLIMEEYKIKIIESIVVLFSYVIFRIAIQKAIESVRIKFAHQNARAKIVKKLINFFLLFISLQFLLLIWGVEKDKLIIFATSMLTVLGIAFFAQWSILSNITSALIIFFSHPAKIGDTITLVEKEYPVEGKIIDIQIFFIILKNENSELITIPNNIFMQKIISRKSTD
ncbi:MAG: mechanosensitive ion channel [Flammeovirgaceae bacterium]|jgi:small-conductance mechanosensitive channel|nr:mechanosensitive ion channel [Flammeovirgaceae bacterium]